MRQLEALEALEVGNADSISVCAASLERGRDYHFAGRMQSHLSMPVSTGQRHQQQWQWQIDP
ncbi:hypothetical protein LY78DRAFT_664555 [Colletotrichum sublineola]|nr:hypothetical protein LY78DRAFT_664555 [Colletotrichum sublineola]